MCRYCGYRLQPGYPGDVHVACAEERIAALEQVLFDLVNMERTVATDMGGKPRTFAYMRNGKVLAECLDRARALLPYDMQPTNPHHGGKQST